MDARLYVEAIARLGSRPHHPAGDEIAELRRAYIERLLSFSLPEHSRRAVDRGLGVFRTHTIPRAAVLMQEVAEGTRQRREALAPVAARRLSALESAVDLLGLVRQARDEVTHTRVIADLLGGSRKAPAATRAACLRGLEKLLHARGGSSLAALDLTDVSVRSEVWVGANRRVDLVLESAKAKVFIEAKIDAGEGDGQLDAYGISLRSSLRPEQVGVLVFLTARVEQVASTSHPHVHITFEDLLVAWLGAADDGAGQDASALMAYLKSVAIHICGIAEDGGFASWPVHVQRRCLALFEKGLRA